MKILIIGGSSGIGGSLAQIIDERGHELFLTTRKKNVESLGHQFSDAQIFVLNLQNEKSIYDFQNSVKGITFNWVVFCPSVISNNERLLLNDKRKIEKFFSTNVLSFIYMSTPLVDQISDHGGIIAITSTVNISGNGYFPLYTSTKGALESYVLSLKLMLEERNKFAFAIAPGPTNTLMRDSVAGDAHLHQPPSKVAHFIYQIICNPDKYKEYGPLVIINGKKYSLSKELVSLN